jgi:hypothetical protein
MGWTTPRTWVTSEVVTAAELNANVRDNLNAINGFVRKTADESVTSSGVLQNDDHLFYTIGVAGTYVIDLSLIGTSAANAAGDLTTAFTFPTGTLNFFCDGLDTSLASSSVGTVNRPAGPATSGTAIGLFGLSTAPTFIRIRAMFVATATGTLQFQWAQQASNASASTIKAGSFMTVQQTA